MVDVSASPTLGASTHRFHPLPGMQLDTGPLSPTPTRKAPAPLVFQSQSWQERDLMSFDSAIPNGLPSTDMPSQDQLTLPPLSPLFSSSSSMRDISNSPVDIPLSLPIASDAGSFDPSASSAVHDIGQSLKQPQSSPCLEVPAQLDEESSSESDAAAVETDLTDVEPEFQQNTGPGGKEPTSSRRLLGSLSPGSNNVLHLLPSLASVASGGPVTPRRPPIMPLTPLSTRAPAPPVRFPSPKRVARSSSPSKFAAQRSMDTTAGHGTPAKRITIAEAVSRGQLSPQKGAQLISGHSTAAGIITPRRNPPSESPARRVLVGSSQAAAIPSSANSGLGRGRFFGTPIRLTSPVRSRSLEPVLPVNPPPFEKKRRGWSVEPPSSIVAKSSLQSATPSRGVTRLPFPLRSQGSKNAPQAIPEEPEEASTSSRSPAISSTLKPEQSALRQRTSKIPRIGGKPYSRPTIVKNPSGSLSHKSDLSLRSEVDVQPAVHYRILTRNPQSRVPSSSLPQRQKPLSRQPLPAVSRLPGLATQSESRGLKRKREEVTRLSPGKMKQLLAETTPPSSTLTPAEAHVLPSTSSTSLFVTESPIASQIEVASGQSPKIESVVPAVTSEFLALGEDSESTAPSNRRTTRSRRKLPATTADISTAVPLRRRPISYETGPFSSMSAVALRTLTSSNTMKNQRYLAALLQTEVIRKDGDRPASPVMKMKPKSAAEDPAHARKARAERRSRREGPSQWDASDEEEEVLDSSPLAKKHKRGSGEQEDYMTPHPEDHDSDGKKRVKWDHGLTTSVFVDEVQPRSYSRPQDNVKRKGCLAVTAKVRHRHDYLHVMFAS